MASAQRCYIFFLVKYVALNDGNIETQVGDHVHPTHCSSDGGKLLMRGTWKTYLSCAGQD